MIRCAVLVGVLLGSNARVAADPVNLHVRSSSHLVTSGGTALDLPPGYFLDEPSHIKLDVEMRRLQTAETRLVAENKSLHSSADHAALYVVMIAVATGIAFGVYIDRKLQ